MVSAAFSILGYDSVAHLCEEMHAPAVYAPRAMIGSVLMSLPAGLIFILAVVFTIKDIDVVAQQMCVSPRTALSSSRGADQSLHTQVPAHLHRPEGDG